MNRRNLSYVPVPEAAPPAELFAAAAAQEHRAVTDLAPGAGPVSLGAGPNLGTTTDAETGVEQTLFGVVRAGGEQYGIGEAYDHRTHTLQRVVTRLAPDGHGRPTVLGTLNDGATLRVGTDEAGRGGLFSVHVTNRGYLQITDVQTAASLLQYSRTAEAALVPAEPTAQTAASGGLQRYFHRKKADIAPAASTEPPADPLADTAAWSVDPTRMRELMVAEPYRALEQVVTPDELARQARLARERIDASPALSELHRLHEKLVSNSREAQDLYNLQVRQRKGEDVDLSGRRSDREILAENEKLRDAEESFTDAERDEHAWLRTQLDNITGVQAYTVHQNDPTGRMLLNILHSAAPINPDNGQLPPFAHYAQNTDEAWQRVTNDQIRAFFAGRVFREGLPTVSGGSVYVNPPEGGTFDVPGELMVGLTAFHSWLGQGAGGARDGSKRNPYLSKFGKNDMSSLNGIKHYASLPTPVPPVKVVRVMIQPNGKVLCDNGSGDSHRAAAAMLRGEPIRAKQLHFLLLDQNFV